MADREGKDDDQLSIGGPQAPDYLRPVYANYATVNHTPWDFRLTFALVRAPMPGPETEAAKKGGGQVTPEVVAEIILPANLMHGFVSAIQGNFDKYLTSYGPPGLNPEGPELPEGPR
jgi:hypothetical protein